MRSINISIKIPLI